MRRRLVITDLTRMQGEGVCIAGYLVDDDGARRCVRPEFRYGRLTEPWLVSGREAVVRPFAVAELDLKAPCSRARSPHTEDWIVDERYRVGRGALAPEERLALLTDLDDGSVERIFGAPVHEDRGWFVAAGQGTRSLGTVRPRGVVALGFRPRPEAGRWEYRLTFRDENGRLYNLAVTDLTFRYYLDHLRDGERQHLARAAARLLAVLQAADHLYLRIGLARGWGERPDRCHLQINGVYSFPDYLDGRCFADLVPAARYEVDLSEVPF